MKRKLLLIPFSTVLLTGCFSFFPKQEEIKEEKTKQEITHSYDEVESLTIFWSEIFKQSESEYYVYLYSETCSHCNSIKDLMIEYALTQKTTIYFIKSSSEHNLSDIASTGVNNLSDLYIRGYPSLLKLKDKTVISNLAGVTPIKTELGIK